VPLFDGIELVFYQVCDMDRSVDFYERVLGLTLVGRAGRDLAQFDVGGTELSLTGELATRPHQGGATVVLRTSDVKAVEAHLAANDVPRGWDDPDKTSLSFYDPDGNQLLAVQAA
jgi:catechol 2,3-dioxygenase-like lactoylglutathione lyase family enzyme